MKYWTKSVLLLIIIQICLNMTVIGLKIKLFKAMPTKMGPPELTYPNPRNSYPNEWWSLLSISCLGSWLSLVQQILSSYYKYDFKNKRNNLVNLPDVFFLGETFTSLWPQMLSQWKQRQKPLFIVISEKAEGLKDSKNFVFWGEKNDFFCLCIFIFSATIIQTDRTQAW